VGEYECADAAILTLGEDACIGELGLYSGGNLTGEGEGLNANGSGEGGRDCMLMIVYQLGKRCGSRNSDGTGIVE
jgi:hypothetical protein